MRPGHLHVCLYQPEIPQNTGAIGRLVAGAGCRLHLIRPFGFSDDDRQLKRAGLDYWPFLDLEIHDDLQTCLQLFEPKKIAFLSKKAEIPYTDLDSDIQLLVFGQETSGLPEEVHHQYSERFFKIPLFHSGVRSLNLANAVSVVVYDQVTRRSIQNSRELYP